MARIENRNKPEKITFTISSYYRTCGAAIVEEIIIYFKNINYTTYFDLNTNSTNIISKINTNLEPYTYSTQKYEIVEIPDKVCHYIMNMAFCVDRKICKDKKY